MADHGLSPLERALSGAPSRRQWLAWAAAAGLAGCAVPGVAPLPASEPPAWTDAPPPLAREFRAAWVATVAHIDWPSRRGLGAAQQRAEMLALLDQARAVGLNAIVLQVRPAADAIYPSALEPWSEFLTGACGRAPDTAWDPLAEWVEQAHRRGIELHAWFNPYRARHPSATSALPPLHVAQAEPQIVRRYGDLLWMDPAEPRAAQRMVDVVLDVVQRYDIDGVHIDDYFYPYPVTGPQGQELPFPDDAPWGAAQLAGTIAPGTTDRAAWRRGHVDRLIERLHSAIHVAKPWVRFGISPFGLPRPERRPPGITGFSQYDKLHADVERWLGEGWLDYLAPQLYWPIAQAPQAFPVLLDAWLRDNPRGRHVWPGLFTSRIGAADRAYAPAEVLAQIDAVRSRETAQPAAGGHLHFSMVALMQNREGIADLLRLGPYARPALPPSTPWLAEAAPGRPQAVLTATGEGARLRWAPGPGAPWRQALMQVRLEGRWQARLQPVPGESAFTLEAAEAAGADRIELRGIGRTGLESPPLRLERTGGPWREVPPP